MPVEWVENDTKALGKTGAFCFADGDPPRVRLNAWPYRSLSKRGFVWFVAATCALMSAPLVAALGTAVLWVLLPFIGVTVWGLWMLLQKSYRDGEVLECLEIWDDQTKLSRQNPDGSTQTWQANTHWARVELHKTHAHIDNYLTLKGGPRTVELGAFLTPAERQDIHTRLSRLLSN